MILRNAAVRHGRRTLPAPMSRTALRQLSTDTTTASPTTSGQASDEALAATKTIEQPKMRSTTKKQQDAMFGSMNSLAINTGREHKGKSWSRSHAIGKNETKMDVAKQLAEFERIQAHTKKMGTQVDRRYASTELVLNPPKPEDITLEFLMANQMHMGHHTSQWNPANARYIYGVRDKTHIISLEVTAAHLRRAARVVEETAYNGGLVLFVGTRRSQMEIVTKAAELAGGYYSFTKWTPGSITNRDILLNGHETKVLDINDKEKEEFGPYVTQSRPLMPDLVVCLNPMENYTLLYECSLKNIPTIGIIDTNADPTWVTYSIPANDDSLRSVAVVGGILGRAGERGQERRKEAAAAGTVTWATPPVLETYMQREVNRTLLKRTKIYQQLPQDIVDFTEEEQKLLEQAREGANMGSKPDSSEEAMLSAMGGGADQQDPKQ